ncbi:HD family phosphohydrolase [Oceanobacillus polygoni]|uniref:Nucleotidyltransferase with HDIG domain n=1 Tax=Oceanobacillus polygoni TaxID=1235259 RepID=A0A9X1CBW6_9BACI|nr:putative nucleotidyltransferase with HDIG domain [Oceanobacillus polygoni]
MKVRMRSKLESLGKKHSWLLILLPVVLLGVFFFFITLNNIQTKIYDIERFSNASETIRSPITIENEQETERKTRETVQSVQDRYSISNEVTMEQVSFVEEIFDGIFKLEEESENQRDEEDVAAPLTDQEKVIQLKQILSDEISSSVKDGTLIHLLQFSEDELDTGKEVLADALEETLNNGVRTENLETAKANVNQYIEYADIEETLKEPLTELTDFAVVENSFFDVEKTSEARKEAASSVDPAMIRAGEVIVREGQTITNEIYERLDLVGLLDEQSNIYPVVGLALLIVMICSFIAVEMYHISKQNQWSFEKMLAIFFISIIVVSLMKIISVYTTQSNQLFFVTPIATGVILIKMLINERLAIVLSILYAILGSVIFNGQIAGSLNVEAGIYFLVSQLAGIIFLMNVKDRLTILKTGLGVAFVNIVTVLLFLFLSFEKYSWFDLFVHTSFGLGSAVLATVLAIGLLPFFETILGILSDIKLLQLSNPNQPLLKKLLTESPGTYHHSVMVANISETACEAIGANGLLARVGAYYHDLGKTARPQYFIENQLSIRNPHDFIDPKKSAEIIIRHPYDGAELLKKHKMPKEIIDIAKQHHGTSLLKFFYYKEKEKNPNVEESIFRYPGPKPQTKEAAIICICDSVEAAVRSLEEPTTGKIEEIVASIVKSRLADGQLDESPLTLKELHVIHRTIIESLKGIFHSRIQYPSKEGK